MDSNFILQFLREQKPFLASQFGVSSIGLFGSFAKNTQRADSDVDILVELEKVDYLKLVGLLVFLEKNFNRKIDLTRKGPHLRPAFLQSIESDILYA